MGLMVNLPKREPRRTLAVCEVISRVLIATNNVLSGSEGRDYILNLLNNLEVEVRTKWGIVKLPRDLNLIKSVGWDTRCVVKAFLKVLKPILLDVLSSLSNDYVGSLEEVRAASILLRSQPPTVYSYMALDGSDYSVTNEYLAKVLETLNDEFINELKEELNVEISRKLRIDELLDELNNYLSSLCTDLGVECYVDDYDRIADYHIIKFVIDGKAYMTDVEGSLNDVKELLKEVVDEFSKDLIRCPFCGREYVRVRLYDLGRCECGAKVVQEVDGLWVEGCNSLGIPVPQNFKDLWIDKYFNNVKYLGRGVDGSKAWIYKEPWEPNWEEISKGFFPHKPEVLKKASEVLKDLGFKYFNYVNTDWIPDYGKYVERGWGLIKHYGDKTLIIFTDMDEVMICLNIGITNTEGFEVIFDEGIEDEFMKYLSEVFRKYLGFKLVELPPPYTELGNLVVEVCLDVSVKEPQELVSIVEGVDERLSNYGDELTNEVVKLIHSLTTSHNLKPTDDA